jgi:hypothetical protein
MSSLDSELNVTPEAVQLVAEGRNSVLLKIERTLSCVPQNSRNNSMRQCQLM